MILGDFFFALYESGVNHALRPRVIVGQACHFPVPYQIHTAVSDVTDIRVFSFNKKQGDSASHSLAAVFDDSIAYAPVHGLYVCRKILFQLSAVVFVQLLNCKEGSELTELRPAYAVTHGIGVCVMTLVVCVYIVLIFRILFVKPVDVEIGKDEAIFTSKEETTTHLQKSIKVKMHEDGAVDVIQTITNKNTEYHDY